MSLADPGLDADAIEELYARGVTDGLPVVPPTRGRGELDINCGAGVFGSGWRANATIGRALRLVCVNVGGARPGEVSMSTLAHPGRYTYCIGEREEASPWESLAVEHGFAPGDSTVAVLAADAPLGVYDQRSRTPEDLLATLAASLAVVAHHKMTHWGDTLLVLSPEHVRIPGDAGWTKAEVRRWLWERLQRPVRELLPGRDGGERSEEHTSELQSRLHLVCRLLLEKKKKKNMKTHLDVTKIEIANEGGRT